MKVSKCDICGVIDDTVVETGSTIVLTASGGISRHEYGFHYDVRTHGTSEELTIIVPFKRERSEKWVQHGCMQCIKNHIAEQLAGLQSLVRPFAVRPVSQQYVGKGTMITAEQKKALDVLKPLLLNQ